MNFLCDRCKQKYHVADEKVRGRAVTRFKCKKCEHVIELRLAGDGMPAGGIPDDPSGSISESPASIPPPAAPTAAPRPPTSTGLPAAPRPPTSTGLPAAPRPPTTTGLPSSPRAPTGTALPTARPAGGSALPSLGASRGAAAAPLPSSPAAAPRRQSIPPSPLLSGSPRPATSTGLPAAGAARPAVVRPGTGTGLSTAAARSVTAPAPSPLRSGLAGKSAAEPASRSTAASALLNAAETGWYAGVRDLPVGPLTRSELAARIEAGDITPDSLVWREGLDDWRALRSVDELSDLMRAAAQKMSDGLLGTMSRREPSSAGKIVPIQQARTPARDAGGFGGDDDEPTRMTALSELITKAEERGLVSPLAAPSTQSSRPAAGVAGKAPVAAAPIAAPTPAPTPAAAPTPAPTAAPRAASAPVAAPVPAASPSALAGPTEATFTMDPVAAGLAPAALAEPTPRREERRGGFGMWIMMAGVLAVGVLGGLFINLRRPTTVPVATVVPPVHPPVAEPPIRQVGSEIHLTEPPPTAPTPPTPVAPVPPVVAAITEGPHHVAASPGTHTQPAVSGAARPGGGLTAAQVAALNAQLGATTGGIAQSTGPTNTHLSTQPQTQDTNNGLTGEQRAGQIIATLRRANVVDSCWTAAQRRNPAHPAESIHVGIDVSPTGRASGVRVTGAQDPDLVNCIQTRTRAQPYGAGGSVSTEVAFNLVPGQ